VIVPEAAAARRGIQPVVSALANGGVKAVVRRGQLVRFTASITAPPGAGRIVAAAWDFDGKGTFPVNVLPAGAAKPALTVSTSHAFPRPGTYFPALRVASERNGDIRSPYARIQNLGRVRVVVR
jgi:hypothetical protein